MEGIPPQDLEVVWNHHTVRNIKLLRVFRKAPMQAGFVQNKGQLVTVKKLVLGAAACGQFRQSIASRRFNVGNNNKRKIIKLGPRFPHCNAIVDLTKALWARSQEE
jgi:hypothetical protein